MSRTTKWIHAGLICLLAGFALCLTVAGLNGFDWAGLGTELHDTPREYVVDEPFDTIDLRAGGEDVTLRRAADGVCRVVTGESDDPAIRTVVEVRGGALRISRQDRRPWYRHVGFTWTTGESGTTVYLPEDFAVLTVQSASGDVTVEGDLRFDTLTVATTSGDVELAGEVRESLRVRTTSGDVKLRGLQGEGALSLASTSGDLRGENLRCGSLTAESTSGEQRYEGLRAGRVALTSTSGDIRLERLDADEVEIHTASGEVRGTVTKPMDFSGSTASGNLHLPESVSGGTFRVSTASGDVRITCAD